MQKILSRILQAPIRFYRAFISPVLPQSCRFYPPCSVYAIQAIEKHGAFKGGYLMIRRLLKCNPWCGCGGHDPVPEEFHWAFDRRRPIGYKRPES